MTKKRKPYLSPVPAEDRRLNEIDQPFNGKTVERIVDNPFSAVGGKIAVTVSARDDPFELMRARRQLDECQAGIGVYVRNLFETAEGGDLKAMDPTKEPVDGRGAMAEPRTDAQAKARKRLDDGKRATGKHGWGLVCAVLRDRVGLSELAASQAIEPKFLLRWFREALDTLAELYGASTAAGRRKAA